jgi:hypothetical protein
MINMASALDASSGNAWAELQDRTLQALRPPAAKRSHVANYS